YFFSRSKDSRQLKRKEGRKSHQDLLTLNTFNHAIKINLPTAGLLRQHALSPSLQCRRIRLKQGAEFSHKQRSGQRPVSQPQTRHRLSTQNKLGSYRVYQQEWPALSVG